MQCNREPRAQMPLNDKEIEKLLLFSSRLRSRTLSTTTTTMDFFCFYLFQIQKTKTHSAQLKTNYNYGYDVRTKCVKINFARNVNCVRVVIVFFNSLGHVAIAQFPRTFALSLCIQVFAQTSIDTSTDLFMVHLSPQRPGTAAVGRTWSNVQTEFASATNESIARSDNDHDIVAYYWIDLISRFVAYSPYSSFHAHTMTARNQRIALPTTKRSKSKSNEY